MSNNLFKNGRTIAIKNSTCTPCTCRFNITNSLLISISHFCFIRHFQTWQNSGQNRIRIALQPTSQEYRDVLAQFRETMETKYSEIIKIERIQNERWYKQVDSLYN
jgi:hypothetical protein